LSLHSYVCLAPLLTTQNVFSPFSNPWDKDTWEQLHNVQEQRDTVQFILSDREQELSNCQTGALFAQEVLVHTQQKLFQVQCSFDDDLFTMTQAEDKIFALERELKAKESQNAHLLERLAKAEALIESQRKEVEILASEKEAILKEHANQTSFLERQLEALEKMNSSLKDHLELAKSALAEEVSKIYRLNWRFDIMYIVFGSSWVLAILAVPFLFDAQAVKTGVRRKMLATFLLNLAYLRFHLYWIYEYSPWAPPSPVYSGVDPIVEFPEDKASRRRSNQGKRKEMPRANARSSFFR